MFNSFLLFLSRIYQEISDLFARFCALFGEKEKVYEVIKDNFHSSSNFREFYKNNVSLGLYHFYRGNISDAKFRFKMLNGLYRNKPLIPYNLARCFLLSGETKKARAIFDAIISQGREYEEVKFFLNFLNGQKIARIPNFIVKERYEHLAQEYVERFLIGRRYIGHKLVFEGLRAIIGARLTSAELSILDLGCGTGVCTHFLKLNGVVGEATGVDISENMLEIAKRCLVDGKPVFDSVVCEDIRSFLLSQENKYDLVIAADSFSYLGDLSDVIPSCITILKDGGVLALLVRAAKQQKVHDYVFDVNKSLFYYSYDYVKNLGEDLALKNCIVRKCTFKSACSGIMAFYVKGDCATS
ncbi:methyltransferase domain-containing protein [Neorickettsia findlayensis]|uniref:Methyltransferase domain-containing protein n=1 Tax=Neorickettsia findlayensis TaxID=2686014 RepID=A0A6P1G9V8_9RICK|nr:methyltransferase domain-containing protein [Neorickettsia findlayensis]QHD65257.1 methyltransferase domain-containing protein [Neorickettsia findlayensis]